MSLSEAIWLAELHREVYVAILESWVPHGKKGAFARRVGISREYFSYLCALDQPADGIFPTRRLPSPGMAEKIAAALPAPAEIKYSLVENMHLAHLHAASAYHRTRELASQKRVAELLSGLEVAHSQATFGRDYHEVRRAYRAVRDLAANFIRHLSPQVYPVSFAQVCLYIHDAQCVLDRADDALRYAKLARLALEHQDVYEPGFRQEQVNNLEINAIRGEAVAYHNLGLDRQAPRLYERAYATQACQQAGDFWKSLIGRDLLNALVRIPRFSFREAGKLAREIEAICERSGEALTLLMVRESWLRCLIQREKFDQAQVLFQGEMEQLIRLPHVGSLHRALLLKSGAHLAWRLGDRLTWEKRVAETVSLMRMAGLKHQLRLMGELYGPLTGEVCGVKQDK